MLSLTHHHRCPHSHLLYPPPPHLFSVQLKKKFKTGQVIKVRVWEAKDRAMIVTHKRSLVEDADGPILSYDDVTQGQRDTSHSIYTLLIYSLSTTRISRP